MRDPFECIKTSYKSKNVYTEKMMAVELNEARELVKLAKDKNLLMMAAPDTFPGGGWQTARKLIDDGFIGEPLTAYGICVRSYHLTDESSDTFMFVMKPGGDL